MTKKRVAAGLIGILAFSLYTVWNERDTISARRVASRSESTATPSPSTPSENIPEKAFIDGLSHVGQTFNNCSSVGLMIALSHWNIRDTQEAIAEATRPWNNPTGNNDDKSVTLYELAAYAEKEHGLATYVRPNGTIELLKEFIANDIPVVARALMYPQDDIVHYRVVRGYDDGNKTLIESDGIEGPKQTYTYDRWMHFWKDFNYSYLIVVPSEKKALVERILKEEANEKIAWQNALRRAESALAQNPDDVTTRYNLLTALYYLGDYEGVIREFEKIETQLTRRKLWYQMEPIEAYFKLGNYDRVMALSEKIINDNNKSVSELYVLRGKIYESRGDTSAARAEYEKALLYHKHLQSAKDALASLGS